MNFRTDARMHKIELEPAKMLKFASILVLRQPAQNYAF